MTQFAYEQLVSKASFPMWVTDFGMVRCFKDAQSSKAFSPMWVTESGMVKLDRELQN